MDFTFGVCTYNSKKFIVQTLESIKYQTVAYGEKNRVTLIVSDDCSNDGTVIIVKHWMEYNKELFVECVLLEEDRNRGLAYNYTKLLDHIYTEHFKIIDGDDMCSSVNIFEQCKEIQRDELNIFFPVRFNGDKVYIEESDYISLFYYHMIKHKHKEDLHMLETIKSFATVEVCFLKQAYCEGTREFVRQFTHFQDDTSLYYMFKHNSDMIMNFVLEPMILYRIHDKALSHGEESSANIKFLDDLHKFRKYTFANEKNLYIKMIIFFQIIDTFRMKHRFATKLSIYKKIIKHYEKKRKNLVEKNKDFLKYKSKMEKYMDIESEHLRLIEENAKKYLERMSDIS